MSLLRKNNNQEFVLDQPLAKVFELLQSAGNHVGKVIAAMPTTGTVRVKITKVAFVNPTTIRVSCERIDDKTTRIRIDSEALDGLVGFGSAGRSLDAFVGAVEGFASGNPPKPVFDSTKLLIGIAVAVAVGVVGFVFWAR